MVDVCGRRHEVKRQEGEFFNEIVAINLVFSSPYL
jgi:hypothetical protein